MISSHKNITTTTINTDSLRGRKTHPASGNLGLESLMAAKKIWFSSNILFFDLHFSLWAHGPKKTISSNIMNRTTIQVPYTCLESILSRLLTPYANFFLCREGSATPTIACCSYLCNSKMIWWWFWDLGQWIHIHSSLILKIDSIHAKKGYNQLNLSVGRTYKIACVFFWSCCVTQTCLLCYPKEGLIYIYI